MILGIDWLTIFLAVMNCVSKMITFSIPGTQLFTSQYNLLSDAFFTTRLASIEGTNMETTVTPIPVVQELEDVFRDIFGLPPSREIDFCIELMPWIAPISKKIGRAHV